MSCFCNIFKSSPAFVIEKARDKGACHDFMMDDCGGVLHIGIGSASAWMSPSSDPAMAKYSSVSSALLFITYPPVCW